MEEGAAGRFVFLKTYLIMSSLPYSCAMHSVSEAAACDALSVLIKCEKRLLGSVIFINSKSHTVVCRLLVLLK